MYEEVKVDGFSAYHADSGKKVNLAMQDLRLEGKITELGAVLRVRHIFRSAEKTMIEAVYAFMLPRDAALRRFNVVGEGFNVSSSLLKTSEAKETYEKGIKAGSLSVLAQQYRDGVVNLSIGNLRPGETIAVYLEVLAGVDLRDDGFRFRFPFTLAPGYHAKARYSSDGKVGEVSLPEDEFGDVIYPEWWKDASDLHTVSFSLEVSPKKAITGVSSPSHPIGLDFKDDGIMVSLAIEKDLPNQDLILDASIDTMDPRVLYADNTEGEGRFVAVIPSKCFGEVKETPRRIVFVVDRSGSMRGAPMDQAKRALRACLGALSEEDRFGIVAFDNHIDVYQQSLVRGDLENREMATDFIQRIDARGGTELFQGINSAKKILGEHGDILVLTDGQVMGTEDIINQFIHEGVRIHCLGIGSASQDRFLTLLSRKTSGVSRFISPRERVDLAALKLFSSIKNPVAEEIKVSLDKVGGEINPSPATSIYMGAPLTVYGSSHGREGVLSLNWKDSSKELRVPYGSDHNMDYDTLKLIHGSRIITDIDSQITSSDRKNKRYTQRLEAKLLEASMDYGLASRAASLVAVVKRKDDVAGDLPHTVVVPVGMPEDVDFNSYMSTTRPSPILGSGIALRTMSTPRPKNELIDPKIMAKMGFPSKEPETIEDESDLLFESVALMQPDGGMPGEDDEERLLNSLLMLLELAQQPPEVAEAFKIHTDRLTKYIETHKTQLTPDKTKTFTEILTMIKEGKLLQGTWSNYLSNLIKNKPLTNKTEIYQSLDDLKQKT